MSINLLKNEWRRCFKTWTFLVSVVGLFLAILYGSVSYLTIDESSWKEALLMGLKSETFTFLVPISCALSYAGVYIDERGHGFLKAFLPRCGRKKYVQVKVITAAFSGGASVLVAVGIAAAVLTARFLPYETGVRVDGVMTPQILLVCGNLLLEGMLWGTVGTLFGIIYVNRYMAFGGPFLVSNILIILITRYFPQVYILNPREWVGLQGDWGGLKGSSFMFLIALTAAMMWIEKRVLTRKIESIG